LFGHSFQVSHLCNSGKTTQVPQFLVEHLLSSENTTRCQVVCTQPRRISAMSIARRVSTELADPEGSFGSQRSLVGYQVRLDARVSSTSALIYCTTVGRFASIVFSITDDRLGYLVTST
jgi:ATP-dependent RNA helicase DHX29